MDGNNFYTLRKMKKYWATIPTNIRKFLIKILVLFLIWKVSYHAYIKPNRLLDVPLTNITTKATVSILQLFPRFTQVYWLPKMPPNNFDLYGANVMIDGKKVIGIFDPCNALELYVLYIAFLVCLSTTLKRQIFFIAIGIAFIFTLNVLRCSGLVWFRFYSNQWFDFAHHYLFSLVVYAAIFLLWIKYSKAIQ